MNEVFIVAWTGGYEAPQYAVFKTEAEALRQSFAWWADADEEADTLDVLNVKLDTMTIERVEIPGE